MSARGIVAWVAHLTGNFTSEAPLSVAVREAISAALEQGWADPKKLSQASHAALALKSAAIEELASAIGTSPANLEVIGEPALVHHIAIGGYLAAESTFAYSQVDVGKIRALARTFQGLTHTLPVNGLGQIAGADHSWKVSDVISLQAVNGETGIAQNLEPWRNTPATIILDCTRSIPTPGETTGFSAATFDASSWNGPSGIGLIAILDGERFRYPLPHIAPIRTPGSYSLPLLVGSAIAISEIRQHRERLLQLRGTLVEKLLRLDAIEVIGGSDSQPSRSVTVVVNGISGEEVLRALLQRNIATDSGSACSPEDLAPSHVLAAMGYPTSGSLRFTVHPEHSGEDIDLLVKNLEEVLNLLNS